MEKHLSLSDRAIIEKLLAQDFTFAYIARQLKRSSVCISKEVKQHRCFANRYQTTDNDCVHSKAVFETTFVIAQSITGVKTAASYVQRREDSSVSICVANKQISIYF